MYKDDYIHLVDLADRVREDNGNFFKFSDQFGDPSADKADEVHLGVVNILIQKPVQAICHIGGVYDKFPDFFRVEAFIESTHMKL